MAIALAPELLLPGHGRPTPDAVAVLHRCHAQVVERVDRVLNAIGASGLTAWDVAVALTPAGSLNDRYQRSLSEVLSVLEHLETDGRVSNMLDQRGRRVWTVESKTS